MSDRNLLDEIDSAFKTKTDKNSQVHLKNQQRNARKSITSISGLGNYATDEQLPKLIRHLKKTLAAAVTLIEDPEEGSVLTMQGDHRLAVADILVNEKIVPRDSIKIHGF